MKYCPECKNELATVLLDGVERKQCPATDCRFVEWQNPVPVVAGLVLHRNKLLLARNTAWPAGIFSMITGYLEKHESPEIAIIRELDEELGLEATGVRFIGHYSLEVKNQLIIAFEVTASGSINLGDEISEYEYVDLDGLDKKDFGPLQLTGQIVHDWLGTK